MEPSRRRLLAAAWPAAFGLVAACAHASGASETKDAQRTAPIVLVHGAWHGAWVWEAVLERLRAAGYNVHAPDLTGLGGRAGERVPVPSLKTHVNDVVDLMRRNDMSGVILVGHSYGGMVITAAASEERGRIAGMVYLDAALPEAGQSMITQNPATATPLAEQAVLAQLAALAPDGIWMEPLQPEHFGIPADRVDLITLLRDRLTPHPLPTWTEPVQLPNPLTGIPKTYVWCNAPALVPSAFPYHAQRIRNGEAGPGWTYHELPTGHNAMLTMPDAVVGIIREATTRAGLERMGKRNP